MESTLGVREEITVVSHAYSSSTEGTKVETKRGAIEAEEGRIDVNFKMSTRTDMALPGSFVLLYPPAQLPLQLHVTLSITIRVPAVVQEVTTCNI